MTLQQAFDILRTQKWGIPWEAIEFLYEHPSHPEIDEQILFALDHTYDETYWDAEIQEMISTPLWYAIVAENHLSEALMDAVIHIYTTSEEDWDFLNEQGIFLIGKLGEKYGDVFVEKVLDALENSIKDKKRYPTLYLHEAFSFGEFARHKDRILRLMNNAAYEWRKSIPVQLGMIGNPEVLPDLQAFYETLKKEKNPTDLSRMETEDARQSIEILAKNPTPQPEPPFCKMRKNWKIHYKSFEEHFAEIEPGILPNTDWDPMSFRPPVPIKKKQKVGRNDPCPCGSGQKYKKCCLKKGIYE